MRNDGGDLENGADEFVFCRFDELQKRLLAAESPVVRWRRRDAIVGEQSR